MVSTQVFCQYEVSLRLLTQNLNTTNNEKKAIFFEVENHGKTLTDAELVLELPLGWNTLTTTPAPVLQTNQKGNILVGVLVNNQAKYGTYKIRATLKKGNQPLAVKVFNITIIQKFSLSVQPVLVPEYLKVGSSYRQSFVILNSGNTSETLELSSNLGEVIGATKIQIPAYKSVQAEVSRPVPEQQSGNQYISIDLHAKPSRVDTTIHSIISVPVYSSTIKRNDPYLRFPIEFSTIYNRFDSPNQTAEALQFDIRGKGHLDFDKNHKLEFIAHGPNRFNFPRFGNFDQYYVNYANKTIDVALGDKVFQVSNLLEKNRFGRGGDVALAFGSDKIRLFGFRSRFFPLIKSEMGGQFSRSFNENGEFTFSYINKNHFVNNQQVTSNLSSVSYFLQKNNIWLDTEIGVSQTEGKISGGVYNYLYTTFNKFSFNSNIVYTGKSFFGFYNNSLLINNGLRYQLSKKLTLQFSQNYNNLNPAFDSFIFINVPTFQSISPEINYHFNKRSSLNASFIIREREDRMEPKAFHFKENIFRLFYRKTAGIFQLSTDGDYGKTRNLLAVQDVDSLSNLFRYRLQPSIEVAKLLRFGLYGEYLRTSRYSSTNTVDNLLFYGLNLSYNWKNYLDVNLFYRNNYAPDELFQTQSFFDAQAAVNYKNHALILFSSYGYFPAPLNQTNFFASLTYRFTWNVPLKKRKDLSTIQGAVYRPQQLNNGGFIVSMDGQNITTDQDGSFSFENIVPGQYFLEVKKSSLNFGEIIDQGSAIRLDVREAEVQKINLAVINSGRIEGQIEGITKLAIRENLLLKISNENFSRLTTCNRFGGFTFGELKPGVYKIEVVDNKTEGFYQQANLGSLCEVKSGETTEHILKMIPVKKNIQFQEDSFSVKLK